jgi:hypothetical protein
MQTGMITQRGYSKDPYIPADGIVLTLPVQWFDDRKMTVEQFKPYFERLMRQENTLWHFRLTNLPKQDIAFVYLLFDKHIQYRANFVMYERGTVKVFNDTPDRIVRRFPPSNWVIFSGPVIKAPYAWPQRGFQGFRYCTKLF